MTMQFLSQARCVCVFRACEKTVLHRCVLWVRVLSTSCAWCEVRACALTTLLYPTLSLFHTLQGAMDDHGWRTWKWIDNKEDITGPEPRLSDRGTKLWRRGLHRQCSAAGAPWRRSPRATLLSMCVRGEGVQGVLTLICSGAAQTCHDDLVVELKEQLGAEEEDGVRAGKKRKEERRGVETRHGWYGDDNVIAQKLSQWSVRCHHRVWISAFYVHAQRTVVHHAIVEVNVVIGVLVKHLWAAFCACCSSSCSWWCCSSSHTCSHSFHRGLCFRRSHFSKNFAVLEV